MIFFIFNSLSRFFVKRPSTRYTRTSTTIWGHTPAPCTPGWYTATSSASRWHTTSSATFGEHAATTTTATRDVPWTARRSSYKNAEETINHTSRPHEESPLEQNSASGPARAS